MEQLTPVVYRFAAFARGEDGSLEEFSVAIHAPEDSGHGDSVCRMSCAYLRAKPFSNYGVDHDQALVLSRRFVDASLEHMNVRLIDAEGVPVKLPPLPRVGT